MIRKNRNKLRAICWLLAAGLFALGLVTSTAPAFAGYSGTWSRTGSMTVPRNHHTATLLPNGQVLVAGGESEKTNDTFYFFTDSAELYTP